MRGFKFNGLGDVVGGRSIVIRNDIVIVDGKRVDAKPNKDGILRIEIVGNVDKVECDTIVNITGEVKGNVDAGMSVTCGAVGGDVDAGMSVTCGDVAGDVDAGMSVTMGKRRG